LKKAELFFSEGKRPSGFLCIHEEDNSDPFCIEALKRLSGTLDARKPFRIGHQVKIEAPSGYFVPPLPYKEALLGLFKEFAFPASNKGATMQEIKDFYRKAGSLYGVDLQPPEIILTFEADKLMAARQYDALAELLEYELGLYPRSSNAMLRMADLKRAIGDYDGAVQWYDRFLGIMPTDAIMVRNRRNDLEKYIKGSLVYWLEKEIGRKGIERAVRGFNRQKALKGNRLIYPENDFNSLGYALLNRGQVKEAVEVFKLGIENYPDSANLHDSLGEAYMKKGDRARAKESYEKSLELNPENENARKMLQQLKEK
jgi:tetratricopeptide (TPR) repeat protein